MNSVHRWRVVGGTKRFMQVTCSHYLWETQKSQHLCIYCYGVYCKKKKACQKISHCTFTLWSMTELYQEHSDSSCILKLTRLSSPSYPCTFHANVPQNNPPFPTDTTQGIPGGLRFLEGADMGLKHEAERAGFRILLPTPFRSGAASCPEPTFLSTLCSIGKTLCVILERQK